MNVIINGEKKVFPEGFHEISYTRLCIEVEIPTAHLPTVTYQLPGGKGGTVTRGERAPVVEGAIYEVVRTGSA